MSTKKLLWAYGRSVTGWLVGGLLWALVGFLLSHAGLSLIFVIWCWFVGPWMFPLLGWWKLRLLSGLHPLRLVPQDAFAEAYFSSLLKHPDIRPEVWLREGKDGVAFWFEFPLLGSTQQIVIVPKTWLDAPPTELMKNWEALCTEISRHSPSQRWLRTFQMALWAGIVSPLEFFFQLFQLLLQTFSLEDLPPAAFWFQRVAWSWKILWFGHEHTRAPWFLRGPHRVQESPLLHSLVWGVWTLTPAAEAHPLWPLLMHSDAILGPPANS